MRQKTKIMILALLLMSCSTVLANFSGVAETFYNGTQVIMCDTCPPGKSFECPKGMFRLWEVRETTPGNSVIIHTKRGDTINKTLEVLNENANWTSGSWNLFDRNHQAILDIHISTGMVLDYFSIVYGRDGVDDGQIDPFKLSRAVPIIQSYVEFRIEPANFSVNDNFVTYGYGKDTTNTDHYSSLDIVAHELGHLVNKYSAGLSYKNVESGALHEGFATIWEACVKNYYGRSNVWQSATEIMRPTPPDNYLYYYNFANPKCHLVYNYNHPDTLGERCRYPDTYEGVNWCWNNKNALYKHRNGSILKHWFYILSVGKSGTNDNGEVYDVQGITIEKAEQIAYKTLTKYLHSNSDYLHARDKSIQAAIDLFGVCSEEMKATVEAWYAVGLGRGIDCGSKFYVDYLCRNSTSIDRLLKPEGITDFTGGKWYFHNLDDSSSFSFDSVIQLGDYYQYHISKFFKNADSTHLNIYFKLGDAIHYWRFEITDETGLISRYYQDSSSTVIVSSDGKSGSFFVEFNEEGEMEEYCIPLNCKTIYGSTNLHFHTSDTSSFERQPYISKVKDKSVVCFQLDSLACSGSFTIETDCNGCPELFTYNIYNKSLFQPLPVIKTPVCSGEGVVISVGGVDDCGAGLAMLRWVYLDEEGNRVVIDGGRENRIQITDTGKYVLEYFLLPDTATVIIADTIEIQEEDVITTPILTLVDSNVEYMGYAEGSPLRYYCKFHFLFEVDVAFFNHNFTVLQRSESSEFEWVPLEDLEPYTRTIKGETKYYVGIHGKFECELREYRIAITNETGEISCELLIPIDCKCYDCDGLHKQFMVQRDFCWGNSVYYPPFDYEVINSAQVQYSDDRGLCYYHIRIPDGVEITEIMVNGSPVQLSNHIKTDWYSGHKYFEYVTSNPCDSLKYPNKKISSMFEFSHTDLTGDTCDVGFKRIFTCKCGYKPPSFKDSITIHIPPPWTGPVYRTDFCVVDPNGISPPPGPIDPITDDWQIWLYNFSGLKLSLLHTLPVGSIPCSNFNFLIPPLSLAGFYFIGIEENGLILTSLQFLYDGNSIVGVGTTSGGSSNSSSSSNSDEEEEDTTNENSSEEEEE